MATHYWNGGSGFWADPTQWAGDSAPGLDDTAVLASGTAELAPGTSYDAETVAFGIADSSVVAELDATDVTIGYFFTLDSALAGSDALLNVFGATAFGGALDVTGSGALFVLSTASDGKRGGDLELLSNASVEVSGGGTIALYGTLTSHSEVSITDGEFQNDGTIDQSSAAFSVGSGGTLDGTGQFQIGLLSSLYFLAGAAPSSMAVSFTDTGGRLLLADPADYTGQISNFQQGDLIDLTATIATSASLDAATGLLTVYDNSAVVAALHVQGAAGRYVAKSDGTSTGTLIEVAGTQARDHYTIAGADRAMRANLVREDLTTSGGTPITGAGVKIGIISDSFDANPGAGLNDPANLAAADGYLPLDASTDTAAVTVLTEGQSGDTNEGQAMAELIYQVAPGAQLYFASADGGLDSFAASVTALQNAGCQVIADDVGYDTEPFFQNAGPLDAAIATALADGVSYFTAAGNDGSAAFQAAYTPASVTLYNGAQENAEIFANGSPYQTITLQGGVTTEIALQWAAPWVPEGQSVVDALSAGLFDASGNQVATSAPVGDTGNPATGSEPEIILSYDPGSTGQYQLFIQGGLAAGTLFKYVLLGNVGGGTTVGGTIDDPAANAGTLKGHAVLPGVNAVGAVNFATTPVFGSPAEATEYFSDTGPSQLLFDASGNALTTPVDVSPSFVAPDGAATSVAGFAQFQGTSAAAPNAAAVAALVLQADPGLTPVQVSAILRQSATSLGLPGSAQGAGLINAETAVQMALADAAACYRAGTRIATARGDVAVEALRIGEMVRTAAGAPRPVVWLGQRRIDCRRHPRPAEVWPVRVRAHAMADGQPGRDLYLSPDHAVLLDGALIPVRYLVNGASIAQVATDLVGYWHVELASHDVLLAEGLPAESYLDTGNRGAFAGGGGALRLHPDFARAVWDARACAPLLLDGPALVRAHARLLKRASALGHVTTRDPALAVRRRGAPLCVTVRGRRHHVDLSDGAGRVRLRSRAWVPAHRGEADARRLGVALAAITLDGERLAQDDARLGAGWHAPEADWRWTDGDAVIACGGARLLSFDLTLSGRYWDAATRQRAGVPAHGGPRHARPLLAAPPG